MVYQIFASSLIDYAQKCRGMQSVVLDKLDGFTEFTLTTEKGEV